MKRQYMSILVIMILTGTGWTHAQQQSSFRMYASNDSNEYRIYRNEVREFQEFKKLVDRFAIAANNEQIYKAKRLKADILDKMRNEVIETRYKIRDMESRHDYNSHERLRNKKRSIQEYSKRERTQNQRRRLNYTDTYVLSVLNKRLRDQMSITFKLENLFLEPSRKYWKQIRLHEKLMTDFERILWDEIRQGRL